MLLPFVFATTTAFPIATSSVAEANAQVMAFASTTFEGTPLMEVMRCESGGRQWGSDGSVLAGRVNPLDRGAMQINLRWNGDAARSMGYDVDTGEGNILYARWLYDKRGMSPWSASKKCWDPE